MRAWLCFLLASQIRFGRGEQFAVGTCPKVGGKVIKGKADAKTCLDISNSCCVTNGNIEEPIVATDNEKQQTGTVSNGGNLMSCKDKWTPVLGEYTCSIKGTVGMSYFTYTCCNPKPPGLSLVAIIAIILVVLVFIAGLAYIYSRDTASRRKDDKNQDHTLHKSLLDNDGLEMGVAQPISHLGSSISKASNMSALEASEREIRQSDQNKSDIAVKAVAAAPAIRLEQVETFRIRLGFNIAACEAPGSSAKTGSVLLQGSMFEVDQKAPSTTDRQVFLHAAARPAPESVSSLRQLHERSA
jgi:hypothetical protein